MTRSELIAMEPTFGGMFAVIPAVVMKDREISMSAKMLYGIITWRCNEHSFCWACNQALGDDLGISAKRVSALVSDLEKAGHVEVEIVRDPETKQVLQRRIYPVMKSARGLYTPPPENEDTPPGSPDPSPQIQGDPPPENREKKYKYKLKDNPPIVPPEGDGRERKAKQWPDWKPERFQAFWQSYPRGEDKQGAIREWDKLKADDALLREMALGLARCMMSDDWQRGIGIPYACRWIKNRRWEDEKKQAGSEHHAGGVQEPDGAYRL